MSNSINLKMKNKSGKLITQNVTHVNPNATDADIKTFVKTFTGLSDNTVHAAQKVIKEKVTNDQPITIQGTEGADTLYSNYKNAVIEPLGGVDHITLDGAIANTLTSENGTKYISVSGGKNNSVEIETGRVTVENSSDNLIKINTQIYANYVTLENSSGNTISANANYALITNSDNNLINGRSHVTISGSKNNVFNGSFFDVKLTGGASNNTFEGSARGLNFTPDTSSNINYFENVISFYADSLLSYSDEVGESDVTICAADGTLNSSIVLTAKTAGDSIDTTLNGSDSFAYKIGTGFVSKGQNISYSGLSKTLVSGSQYNDTLTFSGCSSITVDAGAGDNSIAGCGNKSVYKLRHGCNNTISGFVSGDTVQYHSCVNLGRSKVGSNYVLRTGKDSYTTLLGYTAAPASINAKTQRCTLPAGDKDIVISQDCDDVLVRSSGADGVVAIISPSGTYKDEYTGFYDIYINGGQIYDSLGNFVEDGAFLQSIHCNSGSHNITNSADGVSINAGAGDKNITNNGFSCTIYGGSGNNIINNYVASRIYANGSGINQVNNFAEGAMIVGGAGDNYLHTFAQKSSIYVGTGNTTIENDLSYVSIYGGAGTSSVENVAPYVFVSLTTGSDSINNSGDNVTIDGYNTASINGNNYFYNTGKNVSIQTGKGAYTHTIINHGESVTCGGKEGTVKIANDAPYCSLFGGTAKNTIENSANYVTVTGGQNDSVVNSGSYVAINGGVATDTIENTGQFVTITHDKNSSATCIVRNRGSNSYIRYCKSVTNSADHVTVANGATVNNDGSYANIGAGTSVSNSGQNCNIAYTGTLNNSGANVTSAGAANLFNEGNNFSMSSASNVNASITNAGDNVTLSFAGTGTASVSLGGNYQLFAVNTGHSTNDSIIGFKNSDSIKTDLYLLQTVASGKNLLVDIRSTATTTSRYGRIYLQNYIADDGSFLPFTFIDANGAKTIEAVT